MNALINASTNPTMSSREIAELTRKRHDNVMRTIRDLIDGQILTPQIEESTFEHVGNSYKCFLLNKRDSLVTVARLSPEFTAAVVDRWQELEAQNQPTAIDLSNPEHLRNALLGYTEKVIALEHQVEELTPKAAALDRISDCTGLFGVREAAKILGIKQNQLVSFLLDRKWAYRDERNTLQGYAPKLNAGYIEHIFSPPIMTSEGEKVFNTMRLTTKGVSRIGEILAQGAAA